MSSLMVSNSYGKSSVRLVKVRDIPSPSRGADRSAVDFHSLSVTVLLKGDFASSYLLGDNERLVPIDTIANVVYKTAETASVVPLETFAATIGKRFLTLYEPIAMAEVSIQEELYDHVALQPFSKSAPVSSSAAGSGHPTSFTPRGSEKRVTTVKVHRNGKIETESGIADLHIVRTKSQFGGGFRKDEYTTQEPTTDQIIASTINVAYKFYDGEGTNFDAVYSSIRKTVLDRVCNQPTLCLQQLSLSIGRAVIEAADQVKEVEVVMPSQALQPAPGTGASARGASPSSPKDRLLVPSKEPFGVVRCAVKRHHVSIPSPFVWNPSFDVKDKVMNQQHSDLFDMISALDKDRKNAKLLLDILQHAKDHFAEEEKKLFDPASGLSRTKAEQHQQIHNRFVQQAVSATQGKPVTDETILFLKKWLVEHIMGPDMMWARAEEAKKKGSASKL